MALSANFPVFTLNREAFGEDEELFAELDGLKNKLTEWQSHLHQSSREKWVIDPGSDIDANIIEVNSSGTEGDANNSLFWWDKSEDAFSFTHGLRVTAGDIRVGANIVWHPGNDGAGSGLDADLWDGNQFATYLNQALLTSSGPTFNSLTVTTGTVSIGNATTTTLKLFTIESNGLQVWRADDPDTTGTYTYFMARGASAPVGYLRNVSGTFQVVSASDARLKRNIVDTEKDALALIMQLRVADFTMKTGGTRKIGFIAQEAMQIIPEMVSRDKPTKDNPDPFWGIGMEPLAPYHTRAIQQLNERLTALEKAA